MTAIEQTTRWWEAFEVDPGHTAELSIGPLTLQLHRGHDEWLLARERDDGDAEPLRVGLTTNAAPWEADSYSRYVSHGSGRVTLTPMLADRPVVIRPRQPLFVLPGEETTLYISSPVWVAVTSGDPPRPLEEISVLRMSDSWFGPSTQEGDLCYAAKTHARHTLAEVVRRPHRAITPVRIRNRAAAQLPIDKLSLPVPLLSVYGADDGSLWTEGVSLTRNADSDMAALSIDPGAPSHATGATLLAGPREQVERSGLVVRAFSGLFG